jgi:hypothetical protein
MKKAKRKMMTEYERGMHAIASARGQLESAMRLFHMARAELTGRSKFMYEHRFEFFERLDLAEKAVREGGLEGAEAARYDHLSITLERL